MGELKEQEGCAMVDPYQMSKTLRSIAQGLDEGLTNVFGGSVGFVLAIVPFNDVDAHVQYASNVLRADGIKMLEKLAARLKVGPDVPFHKKQ